MQKITLAEASQNLPALVEATLSGEEIIIIKNNQPVVKLISLLPAKHRPKFGSAKGLIKMSDDFDQPLADFQDYM